MTQVVPRRTVRFAHTSRGAVVSGEGYRLGTPVSRAWAFGESSGRGVRVCVIDSGVEADHPELSRGRVLNYRVCAPHPDGGGYTVEPDDEGDMAGHGTACASIIRRLAPECDIVSIRVLGKGLRGNGDALVAALEWAIDQGVHLVNLSMSTRKPELKERLHDCAERAYFAGLTIVSAAHNSPVDSYPWRFASVLSVGSHGGQDPEYFEVNPEPPVEFYAPGVGVEVAWPGGGRSRVSGNSFAAPHVTGMCARILAAHPAFHVLQLKQVLASVANNLR